MIKPRIPLLTAVLAALLAPGCRGDDVVLVELPSVAGSPGVSAGTGGVGGLGGTAGEGRAGEGRAGEGNAGGANAGEANAGRSEAVSGASPGGTAGSDGGTSAGAPAGAPQAGGGISGAPGTCASNADCDPATEFCEKPSCTAELGECRTRDFMCPPDSNPPNPVCGCDGVTYWNPCVARQTGATATTPGQCGRARKCNAPEDCGVSGAYCARLYPNPVGPAACSLGPGDGLCWVLADACPNRDLDPVRWLECIPQGTPPPAVPNCLDTCSAIAAGKPHFRVGAREAEYFCQ